LSPVCVRISGTDIAVIERKRLDVGCKGAPHRSDYVCIELTGERPKRAAASTASP
jgi:hypothetical protein